MHKLTILDMISSDVEQNENYCQKKLMHALKFMIEFDYGSEVIFLLKP